MDDFDANIDMGDEIDVDEVATIFLLSRNISRPLLSAKLLLKVFRFHFIYHVFTQNPIS